MDILEVFAGTGSACDPVRGKLAHRVISIEKERRFERPNIPGDWWLTMDARRLAARPDVLDFFKVSGKPFKPDIIWASPPCTAFSTAGKGSKKKTEEGKVERPRWLYAPEGTRFPFWGPRWPNDETAREGCALVLTSFALVDKLKPRFFFIENPQGGLQTMRFMEKRVRDDALDAVTVTYCAYGERRMKPTRIVGRFPPSWRPRPRCYNGDACHESATRGSKSGTQGLAKDDRGRLPAQLMRDIWAACERDLG